MKTLLRVQNNTVNIPNGKEHFDIYLAREIYPALVPGLESLSREIDRLVNAEEGEIDDSIKERFNPCIFLAEFLMRNNPKHGAKLEYAETFDIYTKVEKVRRFFVSNKQKIYKHYCIQPYQDNFTKSKLKEYIKALDGFMQMNGRLCDNMDIESSFEDVSPTDQLQFDDVFDSICRWATDPKQLTTFEGFSG